MLSCAETHCNSSLFQPFVSGFVEYAPKEESCEENLRMAKL